MIYGSICSGVEAASLAFEPLGWTPAFFSEIEKAPRTVLKQRWPDVPVHGDFTTIKKGDYPDVELIVGGTPCQDFSVAGIRKGITGDRGILTLEFVKLLDRLRPTWCVFENVPGFLSIDGGRAFGLFLSRLGQCGYGFAYRILDSQFYGVPQRRRRVFVVGYLGDWRPPAAVLFDAQGMRWDSAPRREKGEGITGTLNTRTEGGGGLGTDFECMGGLTTHALYPEISPALKARDSKGPSSDGDGDGAPLIPIAFDSKASGGRGFGADNLSPTLRSMPGKKQNGGGQVAVAVNLRGREGGAMAEMAEMAEMASLRAASGGASRSFVAQQEMAVRRLTPRECERLQAMPDDHTLVPNGKKMMADGPRYKMIGNSMTVNTMRRIGERIELIKKLMHKS